MRNAVEVFLSIGSNNGNRSYRVSSGIEWLNCILNEIQSSSIYSTGDCHGGPKCYHNAVVKGKTNYSLRQLDNICKWYEKCQGRNDEARKLGEVPIDIDIVLYDGEILRPKDFSQEFFRIGYLQLYNYQD